MNRKSFFISTICILLSIPCFPQATSDGSSFVINEIQTANIDQYIDNSYNYGGWIELYNPTSAAIIVNGCYISDDATTPLKHKISGVGNIASKGFATIYFDHNSADGTFGNTASRQVRFKLDADGGSLYISDSSGNLITSFTYPAAITRCSYARTTDGGSTWRWTGEPTLGTTNTTSTFADEQLEAPTTNTESGFFTSSKTITITAPEGATVRYTTDGSTPTATNGTVMSSNSITISKNTVLRLRAFKSGYLPSAVTTHSYLYKDKNYYLPIVSVVTDNKNLYDNTIGVYTTGTNGVTGRGISYKSNKNMDWERPVNFEYIDKDGVCQVNQEATFNVCGGWSRHWEPTSFKLKAEKQYEGKNYYNYPLFAEKPFIKNRAVILRNGGNDTGCRTKDATLQRIIQKSGIYLDGQSFNPCHVFLNGKYHAMLNMREPSNKAFAYANYGIDYDYVDSFELSPDAGGQVLTAGTVTAWNTLLSLASYINQDGKYDTIKNEYLDIDEYANYMAAECWLGCSDWLTNSNNTKWFRATENGRFHFVMFDLDSAFDYSDMLGSLKNSSSNNVILLFNRMTKNTDFKKKFVTSFCLLDGSVFTAERAKEAANYVGSLTESALAFDGKSPWSSCNSVSGKISDSSVHSTRISSLRSYFSLGTGISVKLNSNIKEAVITVNDMQVPDGKFDGTLFVNDVVSTSAPAGYNFLGWSKGSLSGKTVLSKGSKWSYYDKGSLDGVDWKTGSVTDWSTGNAPLGYAKDGLATTISYGGNSSNKYPTYYFRQTFKLANDPSSFFKCTLNYTVDDGFIIYVNGVQAGYYNIASNATYSTYATIYTAGNPDSGSMELDLSLFKKGNNIIAVEVHNNSATSSDVYWDGEIVMSSNEDSELIETRDISITSQSNLVYTAQYEQIPEECLAADGSTPIVINEVSAANSIFVNDYYKKNDWIELYNTTSEDIDVAGMYISDNPDKPQKYQITGNDEPNSTIIPAHGYLVIWADKLDPLAQLHATFKLSNNDGEMVMLTSEDGSWSDSFVYMAHNGDESVGRYPDGGRRIFKMSHPTINKQNILTSYSEWISGEDNNFDVEGWLAGIDQTTTENNISTRIYYTIDGIRLNGPQRGINIVRETHTDGTVTTKKIIIR